MSGDEINGAALKKGRAIGVLGHMIALDEGQVEFDLMLRAPGHVRAFGFAMPKQRIVSNKQPRELPVLFVEEDPEGHATPRKFAILPTGATVTPAKGYRPRWRASGQTATGWMHLFELELDPAALAEVGLVSFGAEKPPEIA